MVFRHELFLFRRYDKIAQTAAPTVFTIVAGHVSPVKFELGERMMRARRDHVLSFDAR